MQVPVLVDMDWNGTPVKVMLWANRNGYFYAIDRETGKFLVGKPFVKVNWSSGLDERGRPIQTPQPPGAPTWPGNQGATNWYSPSYSPRTGLFYMSVWDDYATVYTKQKAEYVEGRYFIGGGFRVFGPTPNATPMPTLSRGPLNTWTDAVGKGAVMAVDPKTGERKWRFDMTDVTDSGILTTASDLLFTGGREGYFQVLDARTGALLWKTNLGGQIVNGPMTYEVDGKQYVAVISGNILVDVRPARLIASGERAAGPVDEARRGQSAASGPYATPEAREDPGRTRLTWDAFTIRSFHSTVRTQMAVQSDSDTGESLMQIGSQRVRSRRLRAVVGLSVAGLGAGAMVLTTGERPLAQQRRPQGFIQGAVESANGPEAGVWVIAETNDLPTKLIKIVVTDDDGRFVLPELPNANYNVWVRGYGLADSKPVPGKPGQTVNLKAVVAASPAEAAKVYPANYWYSLLEPPAKSEFPGKGTDVNGIPATLQIQAQFIDQLKQGCQLCHQLGQPD